MKIRSRILLVVAVQAVAFAGAVVVLGAGAPSGKLGLAAGLFVAGAVVAIGLATFVAQGVTAPLRRLEDAAGRGSRLPNLVEALRRPTGRDHDLALTPLNLSSDDEIGRAARAFDAFQGEAARLAVSQASLLNKGVADKGTFEVFVNLARRMQSLVDHQIDLLDGLEAGEEDPDALENLFRLDHLATRVRRNAESLLTMAGAASSRSWERPLAVADVLRAGMAEVEDLARIDLEIEDEVAVLGNVAADTAHLLSELLENATRWSPPATRVHVLGRQRPGGYEIVVTDSGIGMPPEAVGEANHILTGPPLAGATVARSLGLVVAGRLARRLGIGVRLTTPDSGGVTAHVVLPASLLVAAADAADAADEMAAAGSSHSVPFALARQEKRARITSQRRPSPAGERRGAPGGDKQTLISLPEPAAPAWEPSTYAPRTPAAYEPPAASEPPAAADEPPAAADEPPAAAYEPPVAPVERPASSGFEPPPAILPRPRVPRPVGPLPVRGAAPAPVPGPDVVTPTVRPTRFAAAADPPPSADLPVRSSRADEFQRHLDRATAAGLVRRVPKASLPPDTGRGVQPPAAPAESGPTAERLPEEVRSLLSSYRSGVRRGRLDDTADEYSTSQEGS